MQRDLTTHDERRHRRTRDAERAQQAILDAALVEFGAHGFAGSRTAAIAKRAGVSTQLITHHFGGKQGVLDELRRRWRSASAAAPRPAQSFEESLAGHMESVLAQPDWARLVLWHALEGDPAAADRDNFSARMAGIADAIEERQRRGELTAHADPRFVALLAYLLAFAPLSLPDHLRGLLDADPMSTEYRDWAVDQLSALLRP